MSLCVTVLVRFMLTLNISIIVVITCGDPRDPLVSSPNRWQRGQLRGTQRYNCRTGFKTTNAQGVATCTSDGSWTPDPLCEGAVY